MDWANISKISPTGKTVTRASKDIEKERTKNPTLAQTQQKNTTFL